MYKTMNIIYVFLLTIVEVGCASGPDLRVDQDPSADLAAYRTFAFYDQMTTDHARYSTITTSRLKYAARSQLESLGYVYDERDPELRVNFSLEVVDRQQIGSNGTSTLHGYRAGRYVAWGGYPYDIETDDYKAGTLGIDLVDTQRNALVWRGIAEGRLTDTALQDPAATVDAVVADLFRKFPHAATI